MKKDNYKRCILLVFINFILTSSCLLGANSSSPKLKEEPLAKVLMSHQSGFIKNYCLDCHDSETEKGQVNLENLSYDLSSDIIVADQWQDILDAINSGDMPPKKKTQPKDSEKTEFLEDLSAKMVMARKIHGDNGGIITMRRLNRREYSNTIEILLGVRPEVESLPDDRAGDGFDTAGASLFFSSNQFEQYLSIAQKTLERALFSGRIEKSIKRVEGEKYLGRNKYAKIYKPIAQDAENARSFNVKQQTILKELGVTNKRQRNAAKKEGRILTPSLEDFGFKSMRGVNYALKEEVVWKPVIEDYLSRPETEHGTIVMSTPKSRFHMKLATINGQTQETAKIRIRAGAYEDVDDRFNYIEFASRKLGGRDVEILGWRKVTASIDQAEIIEFPIDVIPGEEVQYIIQARSRPPGSKSDLGIYRTKGYINTPQGVWIDWAEIERSGRSVGDSSEVSAIFFQKPADWNDSEYAHEVLRRFAKRAFRTSEPTEDYLGKLLNFYKLNRSKGKDVRSALLQPLSIILASPKFIYMLESNRSEKLTDQELAVRLSYFLWSVPPDKELMNVANAGKLSQPGELKRQTARLLADKRADQFIEAFSHQWLDMDRLGMFVFDTFIFESYDDAVLQGSRKEVYKTIRYILDMELPLNSLLKADFVVVNDVMAEYYDLPHKQGHEFKPLSLASNSVRGGLLSTAAVLAMGSDGQRSSPVERGSWVLRHLLNNPPPPAPANVPQLDRFEDKFQPARQLGKVHQEEPQCTQCHHKIDPIGYGMEHFDASGIWRDKEVVRHGKESQAFEIDPAGQLFDGTRFADFIELRDAIATHKDNFARGFVESLIEYGLGRPYSFTDYDLAESLLKKTKDDNYTIVNFIHTLVQTTPFQSK